MTASTNTDWRWQGKRVLVTGAAGFIGRHLTAHLLGLGADVSAFVRYNSRGETRLAELPGGVDGAAVDVIAGDLKDPQAVARAVRGRDVVFHLAALIGIPYSYVHPYDYVQTNTLGTAHVLDACREHGVQKLVVTSTSEVYGTACYVPIDEAHPLQAQSPYAASKIAADQLALSYFRTFDLPVALVRPFNTYGPGQSARAVIPAIITQAMAGDTVRLGSLTPRRDLTFVEDTAAGMVRVAEVRESSGEVINLGQGTDISIGELAEKIFALLGTRPRLDTDASRLRPERSEVMRLVADSRKAAGLLGWQPRVGLDDGLLRTIRWIERHRGDLRGDHYQV